MYISAVDPSSFSCTTDGSCFAVQLIKSRKVLVCFSETNHIVVPFTCDFFCLLRKTAYGCELAAMQNHLLWLIQVRYDLRHVYTYVCTVKHVTGMAASAFHCVTLRIGNSYSASVLNMRNGELVFRTLWRPTHVMVNSWQFLYEQTLLMSVFPPCNIVVESV